MNNDGRLRFSLKTLLIAMTLGSLMIAAVAAFPDAWATGTLIVLLQVVPLTLLLGVVWGSRYQRAFCLGALVPAALTLLAMTPAWILSIFDGYSEEFSEKIIRIGEALMRYDAAHRMVAVLSWTCSLLMGLISLALRRWVFRG